MPYDVFPFVLREIRWVWGTNEGIGSCFSEGGQSKLYLHYATCALTVNIVKLLHRRAEILHLNFVKLYYHSIF